MIKGRLVCRLFHLSSVTNQEIATDIPDVCHSYVNSHNFPMKAYLADRLFSNNFTTASSVNAFLIVSKVCRCRNMSKPLK